MENKSSAARKPTKPKFDTSLTSTSAAKPDGPPPMPEHVLLDPPVTASRASSVHAMAASPWAPLLAVTGQRQVLLFDTRALELAGILPFPEGDPVALAFTPNARYLIVGGGVPGKSGVTVTFDVVTGERMLVAAKEFDTVLATDIKPDLSMIATGSPSRLIKIWKSEDGSRLHSIKKHTDWVTALDFSPDGILLATGDRNGGVWVWEAGSGSEFHTLRAHQAGITAVAFRGDSNLLASASEDGTVRFWEMNGGTEVRKIDAHPGGVLAFAWARDGSFITSGRDRVVKLWKSDFKLLREFKEQPDLPVAVAIDSDGKRAFAADYRGQITVWDVGSGNPAGHFDANPPSIEQRLVSLREEIRKHQESVAAAETAATTTSQQLEQARMRVAEAEAALKESRESHASSIKVRQEIEHQLADIEARQKSTTTEVAALAKEFETLPAALAQATQAAADAEAKIKQIEAAIATARDVIAPFEKAATAATAALDQAKKQLTRLQESERHWTAAGVNAQAIKVRAEADRQSAEAESLAADLQALAKSVDEQVAALATARKSLAALETKLAASSAELSKTQGKVDETLPAAQALRSRADELKARYQALRVKE